MAKRKFGASIIILCIAAVTLISGTYAWFLVGGFAELFDIGFDVMEAGAGVLVRGDMLTYGGGKKDNEGWGDTLERVDFTANSFIKQNRRYKPISSQNGVDFMYVEMQSDQFVCKGPVLTKRSSAITEDDVCFNDFTLSIKSAAEEIKDTPYMTIKLSGDRFDEEGNRVKSDDKGAAVAARVAITLDGTTKIYSLDGQNYQAVTEQFPDETIFDKKNPNQNYIIDSADEGYTTAGLVDVESPRLTNEDDTLVHIPIGTIPASNSNGKDITIRIWLEGNDPQCISFGDGAVAGKSLMADIKFYSE